MIVRLPPRSTAIVVALTLAGMFPILGYGLWRSAMLQQPLWSPILVHQALWLLGFAALATPMAVYAAPAVIRGWPALSLVAILGCAAASGIGASVAALLIALCCVIAGHAFFLIPRTPDEPPSAALGAATGLGAIMLLLVGAALAHLPLLPVSLLIPAICITAPFLSPALRSALKQSCTRAPSHSQGWPPLRTLVATLILAALLFYGANSALPERFFDPLTMHLMIPTQALTFGHWTHDPLRFALGYFPMAADDLFGLALALGGENTVKLLNLLALAGILVLLNQLVRPIAGARLAEVMLLLLLTLPIALLLSTTTMVENLLALQIVAATAAVVRLRSSPVPALFALAVLLPCLAAIKVHGVMAAIPCAAFAVPALWNLAAQMRTRLLITALITGTLGAAQYAYAWLRTGNPLYPLMNDVFRSPFWPATAFTDLRWQDHLSWRLLYRMTFDSRSYLESDNGAIGVVFLLLLIPGLVATLLAPRRTPVIALVIGGFSVLTITLQMQYIRYLWPSLPLLLIVCAEGLVALRALSVARSLGAVSCTVSVVLGLFLLPSAGWVLKAADLRAVFDPMARHSMMANQVATRLAVEAINAIGPPKPRVLFGGEPYGAFLRGTPIYAAWYNRPLNARLFAAADPDQVAAALDPERLDYIIANPLSTDPIERKVVLYANAHADRIPLSGYAALWRVARSLP